MYLVHRLEISWGRRRGRSNLSLVPKRRRRSIQLRNKKRPMGRGKKVTTLAARHKEGVGCRDIYYRQIKK
ncbi:hypothetical protein LX36DRAFT_45926 [Colletotrichum falcatum]|nr:hypothetical protein LX36DRAFT_45926 [Colletotrichum falcatum]